MKHGTRHPKTKSSVLLRVGKQHRRWGVRVALVAALVFLALANRSWHSRRSGAQETQATQPASWEQLVALPPGQLAQLELGACNLLCAVDLAGAESLDIANCRRTLDQWAGHMCAETQRNWHRYQANPAEFEHSEGYFRMLLMAVVLYEDFHIRYNPDRMVAPAAASPDDKFFADSRDVFLHGLLSPPHLGTCSSLPVLYAAIGRRLGYPLKLVTTKAHLFLRWEDNNERFNMEATGKGMNRYDDAHFKQWPFPVSEEEIAREHYLKSLSPAEELGVFLSLRGNCQREAGKLDEAASCYEAASRLAPDWPGYWGGAIIGRDGSRATEDCSGWLVG